MDSKQKNIIATMGSTIYVKAFPKIPFLACLGIQTSTIIATILWFSQAYSPVFMVTNHILVFNGLIWFSYPFTNIFADFCFI